ncbi:hypothetical protein B5F07_06630 [Lachnoclostridium sp. An169]|nr:hypothetical protein B5F07_06630 [Lachnoclostridium sp. An169]
MKPSSVWISDPGRGTGLAGFPASQDFRSGRISGLAESPECKPCSKRVPSDIDFKEICMTGDGRK